MFTLDTLEAFAVYIAVLSDPSRAIGALSNYLFSHGKIDQPLQIPQSRESIIGIYRISMKSIFSTTNRAARLANITSGMLRSDAEVLSINI